MISFLDTISKHQISIKRNTIDTLQVNLGKLCNQTCFHCHVNAGPNRSEIMTLDTMERILELLEKTPQIKIVDLTGGAPEMNPHFGYWLKKLKEKKCHIIDRCNLTILVEPGYEELAQQLKDHQVEIVSSLPCYLKENVDSQRGNGVFEKSIQALKKINDLGYGKNQDLVLNLVYNPTGIHLPPDQKQLEIDYKKYLADHYQIKFNSLFTITNMPIARFLSQLKKEKKYQQYMKLLVDNFNPKAANHVMCKNLISLSWDGYIYDCDFNQMLAIPIHHQKTSIWDIESFDQITNQIALNNHCYGCTAGAGSSCQGAVVK